MNVRRMKKYLAFCLNEYLDKLANKHKSLIIAGTRCIKSSFGALITTARIISKFVETTSTL